MTFAGDFFTEEIEETEYNVVQLEVHLMRQR